jgi:hypothetical protein
MIRSAKNLGICAYWYDRTIRGSEFLQRARSFGRGIQRMLPELAGLRVERDPKQSGGIVERDISNFDPEVIHCSSPRLRFQQSRFGQQDVHEG